MKKQLLKLLTMAIVVVSLKVQAQNWSDLGVNGFSQGDVFETKIAIDNNNIPYVVVKDLFNLGKASVFKYNGTSWVSVGATNGITSYAVEGIDIAIDSNNVVYVVAQADGTDDVYVMKFDGTNWVNVGTTGIVSNNGTYVFLRIDNNDVPYVLFEDGDNGYDPSVIKYDGSLWVNVGQAGFVDTSGSMSFDIDNSGTPYVSYRGDFANGYKANVMKFDGTSWGLVGSAGFSGKLSSRNDVAVDDNGDVYVALADEDNFDLVQVKKFNGSSWSTLGAAALSNHQGVNPEIKIYNNVPYLFYWESVTYGFNVKRFNGTTWDFVGSASFSGGGFNNFTIGGNGMLYLSSRNLSGSNAARVQVNDFILGISDNTYGEGFSLYPNPSLGSSKIKLGKNYADTKIQIFDVFGKKVDTFNIQNTNEITLDTSNYANGMYVVQVQSEQNKATVKLLVK